MSTNVADETDKNKQSFFTRLKDGLGKTRSRFFQGLKDIFPGARALDEDLLESLEAVLLTSDVGVTATGEILKELTEKMDRKELHDGDAVYRHLKESLVAMLKPVQVPLDTETCTPFVILMVGVNGAGKTTTLGKLAKTLQTGGKSVMLAAGDTFRAAAVDQLKVWGERNDVPVIAQGAGADSASVIFDALTAARARGVDILIADTAGRLQNRQGLMDELSKIARVLGKIDETAPHEVMLVLDAGTGQNALSQVTEFQKAVSVTGLAVTKLDGTAKGGVIFALARQVGLPVRFVGVGEQIDDLRPFDAEDFVAALFAES